MRLERFLLLFAVFTVGMCVGAGSIVRMQLGSGMAYGKILNTCKDAPGEYSEKPVDMGEPGE